MFNLWLYAALFEPTLAEHWNDPIDNMIQLYESNAALFPMINLENLE